MNADVQAEGAVQEGVDRLVGEVERAVTLIEQLRREKSELTEKTRQLDARLEQQARELSEVRSERDKLKALYTENAALIDNKEAIQGKIESMLTRLDAIQAG